ncbi:MAG: precorrin-6A reductase [Eubacteriales bacterium]
MMKKICLFAGTTEGRQLAVILHHAAELTVCVATEYGEVLLDGIDGIRIHTGRLDRAEMSRFFEENSFELIIDATHPYAEAVTENIMAAAGDSGVTVMRILRETDFRIAGAVYVPTVEAARDYLTGTDGNILLTTGSKELGSYVGLDMERVWARVLPLASSLESCQNAGIPSSHIIAAQGPFSEEINLAQLNSIGAKWMVTKASGKNGGFEEKITAAEKAGAVSIIIGKPPQVEGFTLDEAISELEKILPLNRAKISIVGIGPGGEELLTAQAHEIIHNCDAVIGAATVVESLPSSALIGKEVYREFLPQRVREVMDAHPSIRNAAVVMRGDVGFYSGAKKLSGVLCGYDVSMFPGIASPVYFASKLCIGWDEAALISLHGRGGNIIHAVKTNRRVIALTGGDHTPDVICKKLCEYGFGNLKVTVGERLSYPDEKITVSTAEQLTDKSFESLSIICIENEQAKNQLLRGISDEDFIRANVPMTKSEVRGITVSKLSLTSDSVVYDIGAGTGSVSVECALTAFNGRVYAVEKNTDALGLIKQNAKKFGCENITVVEGYAPDVLSELPAPTHAFIGGSSGNLGDIINTLLKKNPDVRIVLNTVTLETLAEATECIKEFGFAYSEVISANISRSQKAGRYNLMTAQNPVYIITLSGGICHA